MDTTSEGSDHPIAITGMHRSGTSMITRGLHDSGLHLVGGAAGALLDAADDNPEGFWENKAIVACNDDLLEAAGGSWDHPPALLPLAADDPRLAEVVEPARAALAGLAENERWGFKDPRLCLTAAFWLDLQPDLRFVISVRNPLEVALSLKRRNQNSYALGLSLWERYYASVLDLVPEDRRIVTHYDAYFLDPEAELARVARFCGLEPAPPRVRADLRHHDVGVSLDEARVGATVQELYERLCKEAGVAVPRPGPVDDGHVRRLVLDGSVAARHAEQRQEAITRLEERLAEALRELADVRRESEQRRARLAQREHDLEATRNELNRLRKDTNDRVDALIEGQRALRDATDTVIDMTQRVETSTRLTQERLGHQQAIVDAIHNKLRYVEERVAPGYLTHLRRRLRSAIVGRGRAVAATGERIGRGGARRVRPLAARTARGTLSHMPERVQTDVWRVRRSVRDGEVGNRLRERAERVVNRLPMSTQQSLRRGVGQVKQGTAMPRVTRAAKAVGRRLPESAQRGLRRTVSTGASRPVAKKATKKAAKKRATPTPRPKAEAGGRSASVPSGPAPYKWQRGYERMVRELVGGERSWAAVTPGNKVAVTTVGTLKAAPFPCATGDAPAADSLALVAVLEGLRSQGTQRLVVPEGSRRWFREHAELRDHVTRHYATVADRPGAGIVYDLTTGAETDGVQSLLATVNDLARDLDGTPAVLDLTDLGVDADLPGFTSFSPPARDPLPYFDRSVDVVVADRADDLAEAERVATVGVVHVTDAGGHLRVVEVRAAGRRTTASETLVVWTPLVDDALRPALETRVADSGGRLVVDPAGPPAATDADVDGVVLLAPGVLPLPGALDAAVAAVRAEPDAVVAGKVLATTGHIESAGGMVFDDGSVAGIGAGTLEVRAPWHEFVRPVCWGGGILAVRAGLLAGLPPIGASFVDWCGEVWAAGHAVRYHPRVVVVRVSGADEGHGTADGVWPARRAGRPRRPEVLGDGAWRYLIAHDDPSTLAVTR